MDYETLLSQRNKVLNKLNDIDAKLFATTSFNERDRYNDEKKVYKTILSNIENSLTISGTINAGE